MKVGRKDEKKIRGQTPPTPMIPFLIPSPTLGLSLSESYLLLDFNNKQRQYW